MSQKLSSALTQTDLLCRGGQRSASSSAWRRCDYSKIHVTLHCRYSTRHASNMTWDGYVRVLVGQTLRFTCWMDWCEPYRYSVSLLGQFLCWWTYELPLGQLEGQSFHLWKDWNISTSTASIGSEFIHDSQHDVCIHWLHCSSDISSTLRQNFVA